MIPKKKEADHHIARVAGTDGTNVLVEIRRMDKSTYRRITMGLRLYDYYLLFILTPNEYISYTLPPIEVVYFAPLY